MIVTLTDTNWYGLTILILMPGKALKMAPSIIGYIFRTIISMISNGAPDLPVFMPGEYKHITNVVILLNLFIQMLWPINWTMKLQFLLIFPTIVHPKMWTF